MTKKQLKKYAKQLAELEYKLQNAEENDEINSLQKRIMNLQESNEADMTIDDMTAVDEMVQEILQSMTQT